MTLKQSSGVFTGHDDFPPRDSIPATRLPAALPGAEVPIRWRCLQYLALLLASLTGTSLRGASPFVAWDFNGENPGAPVIGIGSWRLLGGVTNSLASGAGSSDPQRTGNQALTLSHFPSATNIAAIAGIEFSLSWSGFQNPSLQFDVRGTATACRQLRIWYSLDANAEFVMGPLLVLDQAGVFTPAPRIDFPVTGLQTEPTELRVRLVAEPGSIGKFEGIAGKYNPAGTWRLDHVLFSGDPLVPVPPVIPIAPPVITFTNSISQRIHQGEPTNHSFAEITLRPGDLLSLNVRITDTNQHPVQLGSIKDAGPVTGRWRFSTNTSPLAQAEFVFSATESDAGRAYRVGLITDNGQSSTNWWSLYIPTREERRVVVSEFLANATTEMPEFVELVNSGDSTVDLGGWTLGDSANLRHRFTNATVLTPGNSIVVWGGSPPMTAPNLAKYFGASSGGLSLNNGGDQILLRNVHSNLIERIVYRGTELISATSLARETLPDGAFRSHRNLGDTAWSPGIPTETGRIETDAFVTIALQLGRMEGEAATMRLEWVPLPGRRATVLRSMTLTEPWEVIAHGLTNGTYVDTLTNDAGFYRIQWY